jgi:uncharacterized membrane protein
MTLKSKLKSFFSVDIEKDLQEEECTRKFENIKLFTLTREKFFLGALLFTLIVNVLVGFDLNFLYLRQILGFLFLVLIPGLLIMLCFKIRSVKFWEYLVYTVGLSVSFIMFAGLAVNWTLPALGITDKPLSLYPILICFNLFLIALGIVAWKRNEDFSHEFTAPKLDALNNIFFIIPMFFPVLSILGAFLLNNHGSNILTMIMLGGIAVYVLLLVIFRKKLNENVYPWAILMISLALLLSFSMRSWFVNGWDLKQEQYVFRLAYENQIWSMSNFMDAYNSCLSLSIFPTIINLFLKLNNQLIFKFFFQIIFIFHSLIIFLIFRRYANSIFSFISSFLYFGVGYFNSVLPTMVRQEIAFLFFGLMLLVLFTKKISHITKKSLFLIFGASMIVSHYSTAYIALALFTLTYIFILIYKNYEDRNIKEGKTNPSQKSEFFLTGILIILLLLFSFLWASQLTDTSNGIILTIKETSQNIGSMFSYDLKDASVKGALFGQSNIEKYTNEELTDYINETKSLFRTPNSYPESEIQAYPPRIIGEEKSYSEIPFLVYPLFYLYQFIKYLIILSFVLGSLFICLNRKKIVDKEFSFMITLSVILMFLIILLPFISKAYNFERLFQQCLIFLSFSSFIFFIKIMKNNKKIFLFFIVALYLGYSLFNLGFLLAYSGGEPTLNLYNLGSIYNGHYSHKEEIASIGWLDKTHQTEVIYVDPYSELKIYAFGNPLLPHDKKIVPFFMDKYSYVYSSYSNKIKEVNYWDAREKFNNGVLSFNFPTDFLNENKNKIYNNGGSEIFK